VFEYPKMPKTDIARLFQNGRSQAVRLPREFRFEGDRVRVKKMGSGVLLEPLIQDPAELFRRLDELNSEPFPARGKQPPITKRLPLK
jgi:antitoxin VapB